MPGARLIIVLLTLLAAVCVARPAVAATNAPTRLEGTVTLADAARKLLVLQSADEVVVLHADLAEQQLQAGERVELEGQVTPFIGACPGFPDEPDGRQVRDSYEAPVAWADHFLSRLRGVLHPPVTGNYTFWVASDDSSELWLSRSDDPAQVRRIAQVPSGRWTESQQWTRMASQQSASIKLEAGKAYYLEAIGQDSTSRDCLAVAWQGPGFARTVLEGKFITPWPVANLPQTAAPTNGVLWEYWTNFFATDFSVLRTADDKVRKLTQARVLKREAGELPAPIVIREGQGLDERADFRRVELEGRVQFISRVPDGWLLELQCGRARITAHLRGEAQPDLVLPLNSMVRVTGFFEPRRSLAWETHSGTLWVDDRAAVVWLNTSENWAQFEELSQQRLTATNPELFAGRIVRTQGRVAAAVGTNLWRLEGKDTIQGYTSADGTNWTAAGAAVELNFSDEVLVGFAIASHRVGEVAMVEFDQVSGLTAAFAGADIGKPSVPGGLDDLGGSFRVRGSGYDIWSQADQCHFAYQKLRGDFQVRVRLAELRAPDASAKAVLMVRESVANNSAWAGLTVMSGLRAGMQGRPETGANSAGALTALSETNRWLKLVRHRNSFLVRANAGELQPGQLVEVLGEVGWQENNVVLERPRLRQLPVQAEISPTGANAESVSGDFRDIPIAQLKSEAMLAQRQGRLVNVRIRGVVTYSDQIGADWYSFVQDQSGGVRVQWRLRLSRLALQVGDWIEMTGTPVFTDSGVELAAHGLTRIGAGEMPEPVHFPTEASKAPTPDGWWAELEGVGRLSAAEDRLLLMTRTGGYEILTGSLPAAHFTNWINAHVCVRGVLLRRPEPVLLLPAERYLQFIEPAPADPFGIPGFPVRTLQTATSELRPARRLKVAGTVTCRRGDWFVVQDHTGGVRVESKPAANVKVGDTIEVVGFPVERSGGVVLSEALWRSAEPAQSLAPTELKLDDFVHVQNNGTLVAVEAVLLAQHPGGEVQTLDVQSGQRAFQAVLPVADGRLPQLAVGSRLKLTGVVLADGAATPAANLTDDRGLLGSLELSLRSAADVVVVERPPWWNWKHTVASCGLVLVVLAGAVIWIRTLRQRVEERTHELRETMGKLQRETQISATLAERDRLAGEIHDSIEQGLSAIMMQMDAAAHSVGQPDEVKRYLVMARNMANFSRTEVQHAVWDMQSPLLENADLPTALRRVAGDISAGDSPRVTVEVSGPVQPLTSAVEHHLLRIAQEAMTNAVKHGNPRHIGLALQYQPERVTLTVRDDGKGFVPQAVAAEGGHFGLHGMQVRAQKMAARLNVTSQPGAGTCVEVVVNGNHRVASENGTGTIS